MRWWPWRRHAESLSIEERHSGRIYQLAEVATSKSTTQKLTELAWTAGPVTLLASSGGYYLGHGKALPKDTLEFFVAYTLIAGVFGLGSHFISRFSRDAKLQEAR